MKTVELSTVKVELTFDTNLTLMELLPLAYETMNKIDAGRYLLVGASETSQSGPLTTRTLSFLVGEELHKRVEEALENARENGYSFDGASSQEIAEDMKECSSDFENIDIATLSRVIADIRKDS